MLDDIAQSMKDSRYGQKVLKALLVAAAPNGNRLPTIEEFILSEVVNGTIDYVNKKAGEITYVNERMKSDLNSYESKLYAYYHKEIRDTKRKLDANIGKTIDKLVKAVWHHPYPDDPYCDTDLYAHFNGFASVGQSTFSLPYELVSEVRKEIMPTFSESEKRDITGIGKAMRKYVKEDLEYIREHYQW
jgi:hypothetical protein